MNHMPSTFVGKPEISIPFPRLRCCAAALLEGKATGAQVVQTKGRHQGEMGGNQDTPTKDGRTKKQGKITMHWHICITYIYTIIYLPDILPKSLWLRIVGVTAVVGGLAPAFAGAAGPGGGAGNNSARKCTNSQAQSRPGCKTP